MPRSSNSVSGQCTMIDGCSEKNEAGVLWQRIDTAPKVKVDGEWCAAVQSFHSQAANDPVRSDLQALLNKPDVLRFLAGVGEGSNFLMNLMCADPDRLTRVLKCVPESHLQKMCSTLERTLSQTTEFSDAMRLLRDFKTEVALLVGLCDLGGVFDVMTVTSALSDACDAALRSSVEFLLRMEAAKGRWTSEIPDQPAHASGYIVIAMGKYGACELNYSSDIDLIIFFDRDIAERSLSQDVEVQPFFVRLTRDLVRLMDERTHDGYVFRTDLRLRPDAGATQIALSTQAGLAYYESFGQNWERAAMIKARAVAGDIVAGEAFLDCLLPFIWRKYLDYAAIADIHAMKRQINAFRGFGHIGVGGHNIKLGPGGIREIEFFVQTQQLIAGGRQPDLRDRRTLSTLNDLAASGWIAQEVHTQLADAYRYLRSIEHRIQMVGDEQSQTLPTDPDRLAAFARFCGYDGTDAFSEELLSVLEAVQGHYTRLFEDVPEAVGRHGALVFVGSDDDPTTLEVLKRMGFSSPARVTETVRGWHSGRYPAVRSERSRERLTDVQPALIEALSQTADPDGALSSFDRFLTDLPTGIQLFALLSANPALLRLVADIMGTAPRLAHILSRRRRLLDAVIDPRTFETLPNGRELDALIAFELGRGEDFQEKLDRARVVGSEQSFLIGIRVLSGAINAAQAGGAYGALAERLIDSLLGIVIDELANTHGIVPGGEVAVVAMGKLGGSEMTAASDVDLILVYDHPDGVTSSTGLKPLAPSQYYARLTQRLISAVSAPTAEGQLYEVDMRLRPSGQQGPVATRLSSFKRYQAEEAWTWEHLALTRARVISGPPALVAAINEAITGPLTARRDRSKIARDVCEMRERIYREKGTTDIWDLKNVRGGMVDLEFMTQYLQLIHAAEDRSVLHTNTIDALEGLQACGVLSASDADIMIPAAKLYQNVLQVLRICTLGSFVPGGASVGLKALVARAGGQPDFQALEVALQDTAQRVSERFDAIVR
ncbi:MAG: bifunctional [glutamine synthetase] adenylyltransferase/[glutamine synthetase]-adenylyl-L-tyrosine phosphorylase [Pseudomonadota bacterium]